MIELAFVLIAFAIIFLKEEKRLCVFSKNPLEGTAAFWQLGFELFGQMLILLALYFFITKYDFKTELLLLWKILGLSVVAFLLGYLRKSPYYFSGIVIFLCWLILESSSPLFFGLFARGALLLSLAIGGYCFCLAGLKKRLWFAPISMQWKGIPTSWLAVFSFSLVVMGFYRFFT